MNLSGKSIIVTRDISAVLVPHGHMIELKAGHQSESPSHWVVTIQLKCLVIS